MADGGEPITRDDDILVAILKAMDDDMLTPNALAVQVSGRRKAPSWITGYLRGANALTTEHVTPIMRLLRLEVVRRAK